MKYLVMECHLAYAVVLDEAGRFLKVANLNYTVGQELTEIIPMRQGREEAPAEAALPPRVEAEEPSWMRREQAEAAARQAEYAAAEYAAYRRPPAADPGAQFVRLDERREPEPEEVPRRLWCGPLFKTLAAAAALSVVLLGLWFFVFASCGTVRVHINPDFRLTVNRLNYVTRLEALDPDGLRLLEAYSSFGKKTEQVVTELAERAVTLGYLSPEDGTLTLAVSSSRGSWKRSVEEELSAKLRAEFGPLFTVELSDETSMEERFGGRDATEAVIPLPLPGSSSISGEAAEKSAAGETVQEETTLGPESSESSDQPASESTSADESRAAETSSALTEDDEDDASDETETEEDEETTKQTSAAVTAAKPTPALSSAPQPGTSAAPAQETSAAPQASTDDDDEDDGETASETAAADDDDTEDEVSGAAEGANTEDEADDDA